MKQKLMSIVMCLSLLIASLSVSIQNVLAVGDELHFKYDFKSWGNSFYPTNGIPLAYILTYCDPYYYLFCLTVSYGSQIPEGFEKVDTIYMAFHEIWGYGLITNSTPFDENLDLLPGGYLGRFDWEVSTIPDTEFQLTKFGIAQNGFTRLSLIQNQKMGVYDFKFAIPYGPGTINPGDNTGFVFGSGGDFYPNKFKVIASTHNIVRLEPDTEMDYYFATLLMQGTPQQFNWDNFTHPYFTYSPFWESGEEPPPPTTEPSTSPPIPPQPNVTVDVNVDVNVEFPTVGTAIGLKDPEYNEFDTDSVIRFAENIDISYLELFSFPIGFISACFTYFMGVHPILIPTLTLSLTLGIVMYVLGRRGG